MVYLHHLWITGQEVFRPRDVLCPEQSMLCTIQTCAIGEVHYNGHLYSLCPHRAMQSNTLAIVHNLPLSVFASTVSATHRKFILLPSMFRTAHVSSSPSAGQVFHWYLNMPWACSVESFTLRLTCFVVVAAGVQCAGLPALLDRYCRGSTWSDLHGPDPK